MHPTHTGNQMSPIKLLVNILPIPDSNYQDYKLLVPNVADNTVISYSVPPEYSESAREGFAKGSRIFKRFYAFP